MAAMEGERQARNPRLVELAEEICSVFHDDSEMLLYNELLDLIDNERPKVVDAVHWAASNGDRSENGDYIYGKKRLREIDRRIRFLTKRLEIAEVTDPSAHHGKDQVFFGATVTYVDDADLERKLIQLLGEKRKIGFVLLFFLCAHLRSRFCITTSPMPVFYLNVEGTA